MSMYPGHAGLLLTRKLQWLFACKATCCKLKALGKAAWSANKLLSYGVSRVFLSQCGYTLSDAQNVQTNMKTLLKTVQAAHLDPEAGKARYAVLKAPNL